MKYVGLIIDFVYLPREMCVSDIPKIATAERIRKSPGLMLVVYIRMKFKCVLAFRLLIRWLGYLNQNSRIDRPPGGHGNAWYNLRGVMKVIKQLYVPLQKDTARIIFNNDGKQVAYQTTGGKEFGMVKALAEYAKGRPRQRTAKPKEA